MQQKKIRNYLKKKTSMILKNPKETIFEKNNVCRINIFCVLVIKKDIQRSHLNEMFIKVRFQTP